MDKTLYGQNFFHFQILKNLFKKFVHWTRPPRRVFEVLGCLHGQDDLWTKFQPFRLKIHYISSKVVLHIYIFIYFKVLYLADFNSPT